MSDELHRPLNSRASRPHPVLRVVVPLGLILGSLIGATILVRTRSEPIRKPPQERVALVDLERLTRVDEQVMVTTQGTVMPSRRVALQPRVAGRVVWTDPKFIPGGRFREGEPMLKIDPTDYELALTQAGAGVARAEYAFTIEQGMQEVARHEWDALRVRAGTAAHDEIDRTLALREPHLRLARENLAAAKAQQTQAELNLARTAIRAPFNLVVRSKSADLGSQVSTQSVLAELAATDSVWALVTVPVDQAYWIRAADNEAGSAEVLVRMTSSSGSKAQWRGRVLRALPDLEPNGLQAQFLIEIPEFDKPTVGHGTLPLGAYVNVDVAGPLLEGVFRLPRRALRDGTDVWLMNAEGRLESRPVTAIWRDDDFVYAREKLEEGAMLVLSDIVAPLQGMRLSTEAAMQASSDTKSERKGARRNQGGGEDRERPSR